MESVRGACPGYITQHVHVQSSGFFGDPGRRFRRDVKGVSKAPEVKYFQWNGAEWGSPVDLLPIARSSPIGNEAHLRSETRVVIPLMLVSCWEREAPLPPPIPTQGTHFCHRSERATMARGDVAFRKTNPPPQKGAEQGLPQNSGMKYGFTKDDFRRVIYGSFPGGGGGRKGRSHAWTVAGFFIC